MKLGYEIKKSMKMWRSLETEKIVGKNRIIDKLDLVKDFLNDTHCKETPLTSPESLAIFLKNEIGIKPGVYSGVYCIYDKRKQEVLYVGESRNLNSRIHAQLIGREDRKEHVRRFARLFYAVLKTDIRKGMKQKEYRSSSPKTKKELAGSYQGEIFRPSNFLKVCFTKETTKEDLRAFVLEQTLVEYFRSIGQCKYNIQDRKRAENPVRHT